MKKHNKTRSRADTVAAILLLLFAAWYGIRSLALPTMAYSQTIEAYVFPFILALTLGVLSVILLIQSFVDSGNVIENWIPEKKVLIQIIFLFTAFALYIFIFQILGYFTSTLLFVLSVTKFLEPKKSFSSLISSSLIISASVYLLFHVILKIPMPSGLLF
jgi:hypothetical protein